MPTQAQVEAFFDFYKKLDKTSTKNLGQVYHTEIIFADPFHRIEGLPALIDYFDELYEEVKAIHFEFSQADICGSRVWAQWCMTLQHPKLNRGRPVHVEGCSRLDWADDTALDDTENKVIRHQDFFDAGAMLYEQLPLLGSVIRYLRQRMGSAS